MSEISPIEFFVKAAAADVREMPLREARTYLRGLLCLAGDDSTLDPLREIYRLLDAGDSQLELIASRQLKLPLNQEADR